MGVLNWTHYRMVTNMLTALLYILPFLTAQPPPPECCEMKQVGDYEYMFVKEGLLGMVPASCINSCIYKRIDTGKMYCFAPGDLHVECEDDAVTGPPDVWNSMGIVTSYIPKPPLSELRVSWNDAGLRPGMNETLATEDIGERPDLD